jgi:hypothetical protein
VMSAWIAFRFVTSGKETRNTTSARHR